MLDFFKDLFSSDGFMPHGHCYLWNPGLIWLHVISDALIALSYTSIPFTLYYFSRKRRDIPFNWMFLCFALFIIACGATHYMEIWTLWMPTYWLSGIIKAIAALASVPTAILLVKLLPKALEIPTPTQLQLAYAELRETNEALETRVLERTAELTTKNDALTNEIVERNRAEAALKLSEQRFRGFKESGIIGIILSDLDGNIKEANEAFLSMVGYTEADFLAGKVNGETLNTPDRERTDTAAMVELQTKGVAHAWEKELLHKDGSRVPILIGIVKLEESTHESVAFVVDLTERKAAEAAVRESEARNTAVMAAALDAIVLMDHEGHITDFNPAAERTFGYSRDEIMGKSLAEMLIPPALRARHSGGLARYLKTGEEHVIGTRIEVSALRKGGTEFPAEVAVVRIRSEGPPIFTGYIRDISERRLAADAAMLRTAKEAAEEANSELETFSYSVAHDLRAPLRGINGFSSALLEDQGHKLDGDAKEYLVLIASEARHMGEIIDALLALARLTRTDLQQELVDLTELARAVIARLRATDPTRHVEFIATDGLTARGDARLVRALLENLLGNAWKFTGKKQDGRIELALETVDGVPVFVVRDNGAGFDMALAEKLFVPFRRLHRASEFEGTGIGLATVQRIARRHGGRIWAESIENQGATFRFTLSAGGPKS